MKSCGAGLASGLMLGALALLTPAIGSSDILSTPSGEVNTTIDADHGGYLWDARGAQVQQAGCEKVNKPTCNKPGRRSSRR